MEKKSRFKKLLTTASAFAVIAGASTNAMGAELVTAGNVALNANANFVPLQVPATNVDTIKLGGAHNINANVANFILKSLDFDNQGAVGLLTISQNLVLGETIGVNGVNRMNVAIAGANSLTLSTIAGFNGGFGGLGNFTFGNANSDLIINSDATLAGTINGVGGNEGKITIGAVNATFDGVIGGGNVIGTITVAAGGTAQFNQNVSTNAGIILTGAGVGVGVPTAARAIIADGKNVAGAINGAGAGNGIVEFLGASTVDDMGHGNALKSIALQGNGVVDFAGGNTVKALTLSIDHANAEAQLREGLEGNVVFSADGKVSVVAGKNITGKVTTTNGGNLVFAGGNSAVTGDIGAAGNALTTVEITGAGTIDLTGALLAATKTYYAEQFKFGNAGAILQVAADGKLYGNAVATAPNNGQIIFAGAGEFTGVLGTGANSLAAVESNAAALVKINSAGTHKVAEFKFGNANSAFEFADGANIDGAITALAGNGGIVTFKGSSTVSGAVGNGHDLASITISGAGADNKVVALSGAARAATTNITNGGTLQLTGAGGTLTTGGGGAGAGVVTFNNNGGVLKFSSNINHNIDLRIANGSVGSVIVDNTVLVAQTITFSKIGDVAGVNALNVLDHNAAATVKFNGAGSHITTVNIGNADAVLEFAAAGDYKIVNMTLAANDQGTLKISEAINFLTAGNGVSFGSADADGKRLKALSFNGNHELRLQDNVNIYALKVINAVNEGKIKTFGNNILDLGAQGANKLDTLEVTGAVGTKTRLLSVLSFNGVTTVGNDATLEITKDFTAAAINAVNAGNGTVKFTNAKNITVAGAVGAGNVLRTLEFAGKKVTFSGAITHNNAASTVLFSGDEATTVEFTNVGADIAGAAIFTNSSKEDVTHTLILKAANNNFTGDLSSANNGAKKINFQLGAAIDAELSGAVKADGANFTTNANNTGALNVNKDGVVVNSVGASGLELALVTFTENGTIKNNTFARDINVVAGKTATLGGNITSANGLNLAGAASKVIFSDNAIVNSKVIAGVVGEGLVEFAGSAVVNQDIGTANTVKSVTFSDDAAKTVTLNAENIKAVDTYFKKGAVVLSHNLTLAGANVSTRNSNLSLSDKKLTVDATNTLTFNETNTINFTVSQNDKGDLVGGSIAIAKTGAYKAAADAKLVINPIGNLAKRLASDDKLEFTLIDNSEGNNVNATDQFKKANVSILAGNRNIEYTLNFNDKNSLVLTGVDRTRESVLEALNSLSINDASIAENVNGIFTASQGTDAGKFADLLFSLTDSNGVRDNKSTEDAITRLVNPTAEAATTAIEGNLGNVSVGLSTRTANLAGSSVAVEVSSLETGVAAGDDQHRYGVWAAPFYNNTTQKARKGAAGYKSEAYGATFGFDTKANDDMIIGTALTIAGTDMKHKDFKSGDKTKINAYMFSIYGMQQLTNNWFVHAVATYGTNEVKNNSKRVSGVKTYEIVSSKYTANAFNAEAMFGYNFAMSQIAMTPMFGAKLTRVNDGGYKETGSLTGQNLSVTTKASNKLEVVAGAKVSGYSIETNGVILNPEVHGFVSQDLIGKNPTPKVGIDGLTNGLATKTIKPAKTSYNLGFSINSEYNMMEYGLGYDAEMSNKRVGHQGTLKVRVNF
ncbi:MAG: autotransporter outer membrane beta-barrel domain-containing protein [Rickettsiales bacterium]|nr:MAG: autotransporter outer membrane beta-barrel domain-containing protein [Rickettsiales bacterium]